MSDGRTYWWGKDAAWWRRERIVALGEEFGPSGPAVIDWLACEAKAQNDGGKVKTGVRSLARGCFVELVTVGHVLERAVTLGVLDDFEEAGGLFTCRVSGWQKDQDRSRAAGRQAVSRAKKKGSTAGDSPDSEPPGDGVTDRDESRGVTERHAASPIQDRTGQDRREETTPTLERGREPATAGKGETSNLADTVEAVFEVLDGCDGLVCNAIATRNQIPNSIGAVGDATHAEAVQAAHLAAQWGNSPTYQNNDAGQVFLAALRRVKQGDAPKPRTAPRTALPPEPGKYDVGHGKRTPA